MPMNLLREYYQAYICKISTSAVEIKQIDHWFSFNIITSSNHSILNQMCVLYCSGISRLKVLHNNRTSWTSFSSYSYPRWNCTCASGFMHVTSIFPIFPLPEKVSLGKVYPSYRIPSSTYSKQCRSIILPLSSFQTVWLSVV